MLISHIRRIDDPAVAKRWRAFWLVISVIALAPLVYLLASGSSWVRGMPVFASADWVVARITHADGNMRVLGLFCVFGLFAVTIALCGVTQQLRSLYGQRHDDLRAETLVARIAGGSDADKPFVLYLRPFGSTDAFKVRVLHGKSTREYELEKELSRATRPFGPLIALGESLEHVGAGRIKSTDVDWQEVVSRLMRKALLIVIVPSSSPGTFWEIKQLLAENWIAKTVFIDAPNNSATAFTQETEWGEIVRLLSGRGYQLPADDPKGRLIFFGASQSPQFIERLNFRGPTFLRAVLKRARMLGLLSAAH